MSTSTCEPCALRAQGQVERADALESIRTQRLVLAFLNQTNGAQGLIAAEIGACHDCLARFAVSCLIQATQGYILAMGGVENARQGLELNLMVEENNLPADPLAPPNPLEA